MHNSTMQNARCQTILSAPKKNDPKLVVTKDQRIVGCETLLAGNFTYQKSLDFLDFSVLTAYDPLNTKFSQF